MQELNGQKVVVVNGIGYGFIFEFSVQPDGYKLKVIDETNEKGHQFDDSFEFGLDMAIGEEIYLSKGSDFAVIKYVEK